MGKVRIPAQSVAAFDGRHTLSSYNKQQAKIITQEMPCQPAFSANSYNHSPLEPKLFVIPTGHKPRAKVVQETDKKLQAAYSKPKSSLKTLQFHDETGYRVKSQRREAAISLLQVMNYYQDDATGRIGQSLDNGNFRDMSLKNLALKAGIALRRAKRALRDIIRSGYLKVTRQFKRNEETGEIKGLASIRSFLPKFFIDLDVKGEVWTKWFTQRGWAKARNDKKVNKQDRKKSRAMFGLLKETLGNMGTKASSASKKILGIIKGVPSVESEKTRLARIQHEQKLGRKAMELFNLDPSMGIGDYMRALRESHPFR